MSTLAEHLRVRRKLEARNIVDSMMTFRQAQQATAKFVRRNHSSLAARSWVEAANDFGRLAESELFGVEGPLWYRGNALENE
ncbi:MAG: hypothetical protein GTN83_19900, partial [Acidobacteria bacterium]|nr:hypothetical protein [Acidobacteriota bacterium]